MLSNRYGHFDPSGKAFTVTNPATPMPWVNVICNGRYGLIISQNGGGFSWMDDAQHNVLTRWEMDLVRDCYGKFLYLADLDSGQVWSAAPAPCGTPHDRYACTHAIGSTTFDTEFAGIRTRWTLAVANDDQVEVWSVELTNLSDRPRRLRVSSYLEWSCGVAPDTKREFHRLFVGTQHDPARRAIVATKTMWDIPPKSERDHWNVPWPYAAAHAVGGVAFENDLAIGDKGSYHGRYGSTANPKAMRPGATLQGGTALQGGFGRHGDAIAALGGDLTLAPGQTLRLHYLLSIAADPAAALALIDAYKSHDAVDRVLHGASKVWDERLAPSHVQSQRPDFDLLNNHWLPYQAISGRLWGRTGDSQQSGARGFRDQLQDSQVWLPLDASKTRDQILLHATRQFADGSVNHWWHALADFGNHTACSDDYLWLPFLVSNYLKETGDRGILEQLVAFRDAPATSILDHCLRSFRRAFARMSTRGLPFIGSCDWNDGLSAVGIEEKGESIWLAMFLVALLRDFAVVLQQAGHASVAGEFLERRSTLAAAINTHAWDGQWFRVASKDSGEWLGSSKNAEGKIHLNPQTWCVLADISADERTQVAWRSAKEHLLKPYGPLLLSPAYITPDASVGYITRYAPGCRENGGVYMHAATWALAAAAKLKDVAAVSAIWDGVSPAWRAREADAYFAEPFVTPGNVDGPSSEFPGRAGWTWYTGSAAWLNRVCMEWVLGVRPEWGGLRIDPCPPASLGMVQFTRTWRGMKIRLSFNAAEFDPTARALTTVEGQELAGGLIPESWVKPGRTIDVTVRWVPAAHTEPKPAQSARISGSPNSGTQGAVTPGRR